MCLHESLQEEEEVEGKSGGGWEEEVEGGVKEEGEGRREVGDKGRRRLRD